MVDIAMVKNMMAFMLSVILGISPGAADISINHPGKEGPTQQEVVEVIEAVKYGDFDIFAEPEKETTFDIDLTIAGDCMLATYKGQVKEGTSFSWYAKNNEPTYFFDKVYDIFSADDFTIVNLENVLTDNPLKEKAKDHNPAYWYKAPTENVNILTSSSIEVANLANNHTGDYGSQGTIDTINAVKNAGLIYGNNDTTAYLEKDGFKIALICHGLWYEGQSSAIINRINEAKKQQADYIIVYFHGGKERIHTPEQWKIRECHRIVDAGADLVIGNHPHVLQPIETYNGVKIVYSMGNFCFGGSNKPENRTILYTVKLVINKDTLDVETEEYEIIPCYVYTGSVNNWQPAPITNETEKQKVIDFMNWQSDLPY